MSEHESLKTILQRQVDTAREAMDRAWVRYSDNSGDKREKAKKDMDMWEQRMNDAQFHLDKIAV